MRNSSRRRNLKTFSIPLLFDSVEISPSKGTPLTGNWDLYFPSDVVLYLAQTHKIDNLVINLRLHLNFKIQIALTSTGYERWKRGKLSRGYIGNCDVGLCTHRHARDAFLFGYLRSLVY